MKAESTVPPVAVKIEPKDNGVDVILTENATLVDRDGTGICQYDEYRLTVPDRPGLQQSVEANFAEWLAYAKTVCNAPKPLSIPERVDLHDSEIDSIVTVLEAIV